MSPAKILFSLCALISFSGISAEADTQSDETLSLMVNLSDGSRILGVPSISSLRVVTEYADMDIPLQSVSVIRIDANHENASIDMRNGDTLKGVIDLRSLRLLTLFGKVSVGVQHITEINVVRTDGGTSCPGLVLWNRLDSKSEVLRSRVGPGGQLNAGRFVPGRFGKGIELNMQEPFGITFPPEILQIPAGCVEFWAKLGDFPVDLPWGQHPGLIAISDEKGACHPMLHFNGNDGNANGGLCASVSGLGHGGTGRYNSTWTYSKAMGSDTADGWHHYAVVWDASGISDVDNDMRKVAVFVDGKLNSTTWNGTTGDQLTLPTKGRFGLLAHQGTPSGKITYDNLRIWDYAKTQFDDRDSEVPRPSTLSAIGKERPPLDLP